MKRLFAFIVFSLIFNTLNVIHNTGVVYAADRNIITPVFPIRGREFWRQSKDLSLLTDIISIVEKNNQKSTWLIQYDALSDSQIVDSLKNIKTQHELGLFLEVSRRLAEDSFVVYDWDWGHWSAANKLFLSGYEIPERLRMIDKDFDSFKNTFGYYPKSYGAWYVDGWSSAYIKNKYGSDIQLGLSDQYATDGYQVWGQYIDQPYYFSQFSVIEPGNESDTTGILKVLWAPREPSLSYGNSGDFSNFSVQVNDYHQAKGLNINYFKGLLNTITTQINAPLSQAVIGIEASEVPAKYLDELDRQLKYVRQTKIFETVTLSEFNQIYRDTYPSTPSLLISSDQGSVKSWWYMSKNYRFGLFFDHGKLKINDLRFYHQTLVRDDDQVVVDIYNNLHRVVPALIDGLSLNNALDINENRPPQVRYESEQTDLIWPDKTIHLKADRLSFEGFDPSLFKNISTNYLTTSLDLVEIYPQSAPKTMLGIPCFTILGGFSPPLSCLKAYLSNFLPRIPDIRASKLDGNYIVGIRTGPENLWGISFPHFKIGNMKFQFPILDHFLNLDKIRKPSWKWYGRQELEVQPFIDKGSLIEKTENYGQSEFLKQIKMNKIFENGYYIVYPK